MTLLGHAQLDELVAEARRAPPGAFVEVGVYKGGSARRLAEVARAQGRTLWLFDTFCGIPEATPGIDRHKVGDFADTSVDLVRQAIPDAQIVVGDARETIAATDTGPVALAHLDCDQYETYKAAIRALVPRMVRGAVMIFDDYGALGLHDGAKRAVLEMFDAVEISPADRARVRF